MQNEHIMFITIEHRNLEIWKHVTTSLFRYETFFYYFWVKGFDIRRKTIFFILASSSGPYLEWYPWRANSSRLSEHQKSNLLVRHLASTLLTFLQIAKLLRTLPVHDIIHTLSRFVSGYFDMSEWHVHLLAHQHLH